MLSFKLNLLGMILLRQGEVGFDLRSIFENMGIFPVLLLLAIPIFGVLTVLPLWMICKKAGFPPALSLLSLIPILGTVLMFYLAFAEWPVLESKGTTTFQ